MPGMAMKPEARLLRSSDGAAQATMLAGAIASELATALARRADASLVVSGGRTPEALFAQLSRVELDWHRVAIALADERWVRQEPGQQRGIWYVSSLLAQAAAKAQFIGMKNDAAIRRRRRFVLVGARAASAAVRLPVAARHGRRRPHRLAVSDLLASGGRLDPLAARLPVVATIAPVRRARISSEPLRALGSNRGASAC